MNLMEILVSKGLQDLGEVSIHYYQIYESSSPLTMTSFNLIKANTSFFFKKHLYAIFPINW